MCIRESVFKGRTKEKLTPSKEGEGYEREGCFRAIDAMYAWDTTEKGGD